MTGAELWNDLLAARPDPGSRPEFADVWLGYSTTYPAGRGQKDAAAVGWQCPGCSRCYGPVVRQCGYCGPDAKNVKPAAPEMGEWGEET